MVVNGQDLVVIWHCQSGPHELCALDANDAVQRHPKTWARTPWPGQPTDVHGRTRRLDAGGSFFHEEPTQ